VSNVLQINIDGKLHCRYKAEKLHEIPAYIYVPCGLSFEEELEWMGCDMNNISNIETLWQSARRRSYPVFVFEDCFHGMKVYRVGVTTISKRKKRNAG
jgi:hypothetical protein